MSEVWHDVRLAAYGVVTDGDGRVLLALWNERDEPSWTMPGGGLELEETFEQAAVRELREETGFDVELVRLLGIHSRVVPKEQRFDPARRHLPMKFVRVLYEARVVGGELTHEVDGSTDEARWFAVEEVAALPRVDLVDIALRMAGLLPPAPGAARAPGTA